MPLPLGPSLGALCALGSGFTWTITGLLVRILAPHFNSVTINALRTLLGGALLVAWVTLSGEVAQLAEVSGKSYSLLVLSTVLGFGIGDTVFFESTRSVGLARAMTVSMTYPLIAALMAAAFLGEPLTLRIAAGSIVTLGGLALIVTRKESDAAREERFWLGVGCAALAAIAWGVGVTLLKPSLREMDATTAQAVRLPLAGALLWLTPWARGAADQVRAGGARVMWRLAGLGAVSAVSSLMFVAAVKYGGVAVATVLSSTSPLFAIPLGLLFLKERLSPRALVGAVVTVAGIAVLQL